MKETRIVQFEAGETAGAVRMLAEQLFNVATKTCNRPDVAALALVAASRMMSRLVTDGMGAEELREFRAALATICKEVDDALDADDAAERERRN